MPHAIRIRLALDLRAAPEARRRLRVAVFLREPRGKVPALPSPLSRFRNRARRQGESVLDRCARLQNKTIPNMGRERSEGERYNHQQCSSRPLKKKSFLL